MNSSGTLRTISEARKPTVRAPSGQHGLEFTPDWSALEASSGVGKLPGVPVQNLADLGFERLR
jgi:hypothetical protein